MDIAVSMSSNEHATPPYESLHSTADSASSSLQPHRNLQQSMSTHSPRRRHPPSSRTSPAPPSFHPFENPDMDFSQTTIATATASTTMQSDPRTAWRGANPPTMSDGQDHDRMETDDDDHDSASEDNMSTHQAESDPAASTYAPQQPSAHDEAMDTTPDDPHDERGSGDHLLGPDSQAATSSEDEGPPPNPSTINQRQPPLDTSITQSTTSTPTLPSLPPASHSTDPVNPASDSTNSSSSAAQHDSAQAGNPTVPPPENATNPPTIGDGATPPPPERSTSERDLNQGATTPPLERNPSERDPHQQEGREADEDQEEDSSDEEERAYWADFAEDTSGPDEDELRVIEQEEEKDALDHDRWESTTFEPLEDPEYIPGEHGRIQWTVNPVNGTPEQPNRAKVMRSPSVLIGGLYWNIKYFPRGNDGTEQMSVYVECSSSPDGPEPEDDSDNESSCNEETGIHTNEEAPTDEDVRQSHADSPNVDVSPEGDQQATKIVEAPTESEATKNTTWEAAAQISCIVYNPKEPRVNSFRKSCHRFTKDNPDWGWTRFHGPWETIHLRKRRQRQALLRNDTLAFTAYIRIVQDDTKSLWWHAPKKGNGWDSYDRIGVKSLATGSSRDSAIIAAISCWLHLNPILEIIHNMRTPDASADPNERKRPLFSALQEVVDVMSRPSAETDQQTMMNFTSWLDWYITDIQMSRTDLLIPISVWESVRRVLNHEASGTGSMTAVSDFFQDILLLKQPDAWGLDSPICSAGVGQSLDGVKQSKTDEARSVQETIDLACSSVTPFRVWGGFDGQAQESNEHPAVLQVELHRQDYDRKARKWNKLTHHIEMNETIVYTPSKTAAKRNYTLFGFIVEAGALTSQDCYSVIRPSGPDTQWIKYSGNPSHRGASCLTTTQAVTAHEGKGKDTTGDSAVAHIVLYVRTDSLLSILSARSTHPQPATPISKATSPQPEAELQQNMSLRIYNSTLFNSHVGRGLPDLWAPVHQHDHSPVIDLQLPKTAPIGQEIERLDEGFLKHSNDSEADQPYTCGLWYLKSDLSSVKGLPRIHPVAKDDTLEKASDRHDVCRIWIHLQESDVAEGNSITAQQEEPNETHENEAEAQGDGVQPEDSVMTQDPPTEVSASNRELELDENVPSPPANIEPQSSVPPSIPTDDVPPPISQDENATETDSGDAVMTQDPPAEVSTAGDLGPEESTLNIPPDDRGTPSAPPSTVTDDVPPPPPPQDNAGHDHSSEDAMMSEVQDPVVSADTETSLPAAPMKRLIYFFVKVFDLKKQELRGVGSKLVPLDSDIHTEVGRILGNEDAMELYLEKGRVMWEDDQVRPSRSFSDYDLRDGCILIVHRRPTPSEATLLVTQGKHTNPITYFQHLQYNEPYRPTHEVKSEYGTEYHSVPRSNGLIHGCGTKIYGNGDAYVGNWVSNKKCGYGTMAYSSGDTYVGNWEHDEPDGEGKMVYGKTQNVYVGGWKKGRRHGKGTMNYEVADEELAMCKICYESEMDALFFDCGHVVACEECARQVDICPVCRKNVKAQGMWRLREGSEERESTFVDLVE
ncbi:MAG: hypothetical protein Q9226_004443 [Calogaya cf. arnoldii]